MSINDHELKQRMQEVKPVEEAVREAFLMLAHAEPPTGMTVYPWGHGYIKCELRFEANGEWRYAAVLNKKWILWYFRNPALKSGIIGRDAIQDRFPQAVRRNDGEIKLKLYNAQEALSVLEYLPENRTSG